MEEQDKHNLADVSKHTPGPWSWLHGEKPTHKELVQADLYEEGVDSILYHGADWPINKANARLIAAAPALLKACEKASYMNCHILTRDKPDWLLQIEAALELAKKGT